MGIRFGCLLLSLINNSAVTLIRLYLIACIFFLISPYSFGQGTTSVLGGKVFDPLGNVIQGATVVVTSDESGIHWTAKTNEAGNWRVDALVAGHYHFSIAAEGFESVNHSSVEIQIADQKFVDVTLKIGNTIEAVTVTGETPLIDTTAAVSGTVLSNKEFDELPSESNTPLEFVQLTPGVFLGPPSGGAALLWSTNSLSAITTNGAGSGTNAMNYMIDGATNTINSSGQIAFIPPSDAVQEIRVMTNAYDSSIERTAAGTVNMTIKSGGSNFHGSLYGRDINNAFNANYYQNNLTGVPTPTVHLNEWGGTIGGPVWLPKLYNGRKKNTFFFFSYDGIHNTSPAATGYLSLPTQAERNGDFSQSFTTNTTNGATSIYPLQIYDPDTAISNGNRQLFANATVPANRISPTAKAIMTLLPLPNKANDGANTDSNNYLINQPKIDKFISLAGRVDQAWNNNHHSYFEYRHNHLSELAGDPFGPDNLLAGSYLTRTNDGATINHAWVVSPNLLVNILGNLTSFKTTTSSPANQLDATDYGFSSEFASSQTAKGLPYIDGLFTALGDVSGPSYENDYQYEVRGSIQQIHKNHTFRYGAGYLAQQEAIGSNQYGAGYYDFTNIWTTANPNATAGPGVGSTIASFLLGLPTSGYVKQNSSAYYSQPYVGVYVQDDWRVKQRLTLNFGLRWDYQFPMTERHNKYWSRFDPDYNLTPITNYTQSTYATTIGGNPSNLGVQLLQQNRPDISSFVARGAILYAGQDGTSRSVTDPQFKYIQPRIGIAYLIRPTTVIRGGYGRFVQGNYAANHANQQGYSSTTTFNATKDNYITTGASLDNPYPGGLVPVTGNSLGVLTDPGSVTSFYSSDIKRQYTDDFSLHLQQQLKDYLFEIGGVYEFTNGLVVGYHINNPNLAEWQAAYGPKFDSTGRPVDTLPGDTQVANPFKGAPYITTSLQTNSTVAAYQLLRPNPLLGDLVENFYNGKSWHYALQSKVQRRMRNGFAMTASFSWGKQMDKTSFMTNSVVAQDLLKQISGADRRFQFVATPSYVLPFGRGKLFGKNSGRLIDGFIGGWEISAKYTFYSGTPLSLPTNSAFFQGGDPGFGSRKKSSKWFDTSKFVAFPTVSTTASDIHNESLFPGWTGISTLPGYNWQPTSTSDATKNGVYHDFATWSTNNPTNFGDVRNPYTNTWDIGARKSFRFERGITLQLKADAFNALNHPQFGNIGITPTSKFFGYMNGSNTLSQINDPRNIQLGARITF